jgi:hypothetical protein
MGDMERLSEQQQYTETEDNRIELQELPPRVVDKYRETWINHMGRVTCKVMKQTVVKQKFADNEKDDGKVE